MKSINTEIIINASAETVWNILMDFGQHSKWNPFIKKLEGQAKIGEKLHVEIQPPGQKVSTFTPKVLDVSTNKHFCWRGTFIASFIMAGEHHYEIEDLGNNSVKFKHYEHFNGLMAGMAINKIGKATTDGFVQMNEALKAQAEAKVTA